MKHIKYGVFFACIFSLFICSSFSMHAVLDTTTQSLPETVELSLRPYYGAFEQRVRTLDNKDIFTETRVTFGATISPTMSFSIIIPGSRGQCTYYDYQKNEWFTFDLGTGLLPKETLYITTDIGSSIVSSGSSFNQFEYQCLEDSPTRVLPSTCQQTDYGFVITLTFIAKPGTQAQFWQLQSTQELISKAELTSADSYWPICGYSYVHRWTYDGYYYRMPNAYSPWSKNMFWKCPGNYTAKRFTRIGGSRAAEDLSMCIMDTLVKDQTPEGYWLSAPPNTGWLVKDYGIGAGFYDTRFNSDSAIDLFYAYKTTSTPEFLVAALRHCDFFVDYALSHNHSFSVAGATGILVEDYTWPNNEYNKVHTSLNHQLSEMLMLYTAYEISGDSKYFDTAQQMLLGIKAVGTRWLKPDGSLEYAYMSDGKMGLIDYPTLTYDDLFNIQKKYEEMGMERDPFLQKLMNSKLESMIKNNITGYKK